MAANPLTQQRRCCLIDGGLKPTLRDDVTTRLVVVQGHALGWSRSMGEALYFEDFYAGQRFTSEPRVMERERLVAFAAEFDPQPQHLGEESAAGSQFGTLVASGWHTAALTMRMQLDAVFGFVPGGAMGAQVDRLAWRRPVRPGDVLHVVVEVLGARESRSRPSQGVLTLRTTTVDAGGETVMEMEAAVLVPRRA